MAQDYEIAPGRRSSEGFFHSGTKNVVMAALVSLDRGMHSADLSVPAQKLAREANVQCKALHDESTAVVPQALADVWVLDGFSVAVGRQGPVPPLDEVFCH